MTGYVLQRHEDSKFVAPPGSEQSYTRDITKARRFATVEAAMAEKCGNEDVVLIEHLLEPME
jgi:hypothetical protein